MASKATAAATTPARVAIEDDVSAPIVAYTPPDSDLPAPLLPLWSAKYDGDPKNRTEPKLADGFAWMPPIAGAVIRVPEAGEKGAAPRRLTGALGGDLTHPMSTAIEVIAAHADQVPPASFLWESLRVENDQLVSARVFANNDWRRVTVTSTVACNAQGKSKYPATAEAKDMWPAIMAKVAGVLSHISPLSLFTGWAVVMGCGSGEDGSTFAHPLHVIAPGQGVFDLSKFPGTGASSTTFTTSWTDLSRPFNATAQVMMTVASSSRAEVLLTIDPIINRKRESAFSCDVYRVQQWATSTRTRVASFINSEGPRHELLSLDPALYLIVVKSTCGFQMLARSTAEGVSLDDDKGAAWTKSPFKLNVLNLSGKHNGISSAGVYNNLILCDMTAAEPLKSAFHITFDDGRIVFKSQLVSPDASIPPIEILSTDPVEVAAGKYTLRVGARTPHDEGIAPGAFTVRVVSTKAMSGAVLPISTVAKSYSDVFKVAYHDRTVFREVLTASGKEAVNVAIEVTIEPSDVRMVCSIDGKSRCLGVSSVVMPWVTIAPGAKVVIDCKADSDAAWTRWRVRVHPGDQVVLTPSSDWKDRIEAMRKAWQEVDEGRTERAAARRQAFIGRDASADPGPMEFGNGDAVEAGTNDDDGSLGKVLRGLTAGYAARLEGELIRSKAVAEEMFVATRSSGGSESGEREAYRVKMVALDAMLLRLGEAIKSGDYDAILKEIGVVKTMPPWKLQDGAYRAYEACYAIHQAAIQEAIDGADVGEIESAISNSEVLEKTVVRVDAPVCAAVDVLRLEGMRLVWEEKARPLTEAMMTEPWDLDTLRDALNDPTVQSAKEGKMVPTAISAAITRATEYVGEKDTAAAPS